MLVFPVRVYPCGVCADYGGEGCGRGEKFAGAPLPPKKSNLTYTLMLCAWWELVDLYSQKRTDVRRQS